MKRALKGQLPLLQKAQALQTELLQLVPGRTFEGTLEEETHLTAMAKKIFLMAGAAAVQRYGPRLEEEQEILAALADILIQLYAMESALLRAKKQLAGQGEERAALAVAMTRAFAHDAFGRIEALAQETLAAVEVGDSLRTQLSALKKLARRGPVDTVALKRQVAAAVVREEGFVS